VQHAIMDILTIVNTLAMVQFKKVAVNAPENCLNK